MLGGVGVVVVWVHQTEKFRSTSGEGTGGWGEGSERRTQKLWDQILPWLLDAV